MRRCYCAFMRLFLLAGARQSLTEPLLSECHATVDTSADLRLAPFIATYNDFRPNQRYLRQIERLI